MGLLEGIWMFPLLGVAAGVLAGLLSVGGGLILVAALVWLLPLHGVPKEAAMHAALASSMASIVMTAASSAYAHHRRGDRVGAGRAAWNAVGACDQRAGTQAHLCGVSAAGGCGDLVQRLRR